MRSPGASAGLLAAALLVTAMLAGLAATSQARAAPDPFYLDLLRDGIQSYDRADYAAAAKRLRLACFGLLDDPQQLAGCLIRLGVAQAAAGDADAFRETFRRIVEVEDRFGAYAKADLPPELRAAFEQRALAAIPVPTLEAIPAFKPLLARRLEAQVAALAPRERRRQLEERLAKEPRSVAWNVLLAELDLSEGKTAPGVARAEQVVALAPQEPRALCVRGLARAAGNRCKEAMADLEPCYLSGRELSYASALLGCRVELAQWRQAEEQVRALPPGFKEDRKVTALIKQVAKHPATTAAPLAASEAGAGLAAGAGGRAVAGPTAAGGGAAKAAAGKPAERPPGAAAGKPADRQPVAVSKSAAPPAVGGSPASAADPARPATSAPSSAPTSAAPPAPTSAAAMPTVRPLSPAEREAMARSERLLSATGTDDLREALRLARQLADAHPDFREAQYLAGEAAYRNSRWKEAAAYFRRGGTPGDDRPELLFYMAVSLYEVGDQPGAASALKRSLPNLQKTPYVQSYVKRILGQ
jgi:tetratricopeptide (TPR) repeat protein